MKGIQNWNFLSFDTKFSYTLQTSSFPCHLSSLLSNFRQSPVLNFNTQVLNIPCIMAKFTRVYYGNTTFESCAYFSALLFPICSWHCACSWYSRVAVRHGCESGSSQFRSCPCYQFSRWPWASRSQLAPHLQYLLVYFFGNNTCLPYRAVVKPSECLKHYMTAKYYYYCYFFQIL